MRVLLSICLIFYQFYQLPPIFCNHFEELQNMFFKIELTINNAPLIYVYPNTIETYLIPNYLLFGRKLVQSSNTTSTEDMNVTVLSSTNGKINRISNHFWDRWRHSICSKFTWDTTNIKTKLKRREGTQTLVENCY